MADDRESGTTMVKRWIAEIEGDDAYNSRARPELHRYAKDAVKEAIALQVKRGIVGAREVTVRRIRRIVDERIVE